MECYFCFGTAEWQYSCPPFDHPYDSQTVLEGPWPACQSCALLIDRMRKRATKELLDRVVEARVARYGANPERMRRNFWGDPSYV